MKHVDDPGAERRLGSDDRQIDGLVDREPDQPWIVCGDGDVLSDLRSLASATNTRSTVETVESSKRGRAHGRLIRQRGLSSRLGSYGTTRRIKAFTQGIAGHDHGMDTIVVLNKDQMGHGDRELGQKVLGTARSIALKQFTAIVLFNSGVRLVAEGSPVLAGCKCSRSGASTSCLAAPASTTTTSPSVGEVSDMDTIVQELDRAAKVITI